MLSVARTLLEAYSSAQGTPNPAAKLKPFKLSNETPHTALTHRQAGALLRQIDTSRLIGCRDYAILSLLLRTGIRRSECAALTIGDIGLLQEHHVAVIQHGKGDKRRTVKIPVDVFRAIESYVNLARRQNHPPGAPLFTGVTRGGNATEVGISEKLIERTVKHYGAQIGVPALTPHGLRATFITLALEGKAKLEQVQYAAGHADPRTTERYQKRKTNLDDNAVDYVRIEA